MKIFRRSAIHYLLNKSALLRCLKCIERESANSSPECSNASNVTNSSPISAITNSSSEDIASITDDAGLKELYMTGMYKSLKGHQTLCDMLKKHILDQNPRKEGIAFERKLNADGTYWKPEQYPKTSWVAAKGPPVDPSNLLPPVLFTVHIRFL